MRKCANISSCMRRPLVIYDFATAPFWIPYIWGKFYFLFYQCIYRHWTPLSLFLVLASTVEGSIQYGKLGKYHPLPRWVGDSDSQTMPLKLLVATFFYTVTSPIKLNVEFPQSFIFIYLSFRHFTQLGRDRTRGCYHAYNNHTAKTQYRKFETNIPRKGTERLQPQFLHSCFCDRFIYSSGWSAFPVAGK